jgi:hypothetical protein
MCQWFERHGSTGSRLSDLPGRITRIEIGPTAIGSEEKTGSGRSNGAIQTA